jgi:hypothetical protein
MAAKPEAEAHRNFHNRPERIDRIPQRQALQSVSVSASGPLRPPINPEIADAVSELAISLGQTGSEAERELRMQILMEDLSENLTAEAVRAAIKVGKRGEPGTPGWQFLPTLGQVMTAAETYLAEQRERHREARERREAAQRRALPPPDYAEPGDGGEAERAAIMAETFALLDAGNTKMRGAAHSGPAVEPLSWRILRESGLNVSPQMLAMRDRMRGS